MGDIIEFNPEYFSGLEMLFRRYRELVAKYGEPMRLYVPNEKRMQEMNEAAKIVRSLVDENDSDLTLDIGFDDDMKDIGYIEVRHVYWVLTEDEIALLHKAEDLADAVTMGCTDDDRFFYELTFKGIMKLKT